jgi:hypothetical protein
MACLALLLCGCSAAAPVSVTFTMVSSTPNVGTGYQADQGIATISADGELTLTSTAGGATLLISLDPPTDPGQVNLGERHLDVEYQLGVAGWASNGGSVTFDSLDPWKVTFNGVQMIKAVNEATGSFTLDGTATFAK